MKNIARIVVFVFSFFAINGCAPKGLTVISPGPIAGPAYMQAERICIAHANEVLRQRGRGPITVKRTMDTPQIFEPLVTTGSILGGALAMFSPVATLGILAGTPLAYNEIDKAREDEQMIQDDILMCIQDEMAKTLQQNWRVPSVVYH